MSLVAATLVFTPGRRDLFAGDETKYGQVLREMRERGELLVPYVHGEPYAHKPPLHFWILYAATAIAGDDSVWPFVLPSIAAYLLLVVLVAVAARLLWNEPGCIAAFIFATFLLSWGTAQTARMDLAFTAAITLAIISIWRARATPLRHAWLYAAALATAAAVLLKGPMAFVVVATVAAFTLRGVAFTKVSLAIAVAVAITLLWLVPAVRAGGSSYAHELLISQNFGRAVNAWIHGEPPWFYLVRAPLIFFPWFFLGVVALWWGWRERSREMTGNVATRFCVVWFGAVFVPFSLLSGKLDIYMLPALVPLSLLNGQLVATAAESPWGKRARIANFISLAFIAAAIAAAAVLLRRPSSSPEAALLAGTPLPAVLAAAGALLTVLLVTLLVRRSTLKAVTIATGLAATTCFAVITATVTPQLSEISSSRPLVRVLAAQQVPGNEIVLYGCPDLWSRDLPETLRRARAVSREDLLRSPRPAVIATSRRRAAEIGEILHGYRRVASVRMIGKEFDVYRRR